MRWKGRTYIFIYVHLQKVIFHIAQMLPDKCPGNSQYFHCGWHICHRWDGGKSGAQMGTPPSLWRWRMSCRSNQMSTLWLIAPCAWILTGERLHSWAEPNEVQQIWQRSYAMDLPVHKHRDVKSFPNLGTASKKCCLLFWDTQYAFSSYTAIKGGTCNCLIMVFSLLRISITPH